jgi:hypothetical protein
MRLHHAIPFVLVVFLASTAAASEVSWMFQPGYFTHSPTSGQRVAQYEPEQPSYVNVDPTYQESGYRHQLIYVGTDVLNLVQTWGQGTAIRPYGEWEFPYRAGATPYGPWGNPQGPWTLPFDSWVNPYGLNRMPYSYPVRPGNGWGNPVYNGAEPRAEQAPMPQSMPGQGGFVTPGAVNVPPPPSPPTPQGQAI